MESVLFLPYDRSDLTGIERLVEREQCLVAFLDGDIYRIIHYLDPSSKYKFTAMLDRNVYSRITSLVEQKRGSPIPLKDLQWAAAVLAFCQIADITFDYASSLYEYASCNGGAEAIAEMRRFRIADNSKTQLFVDFALGRTSRIDPDALASVVHPERDPDPAEFEKRTRSFRVNYTFALKIAQLDRLKLPAVRKMLLLLNWMRNEYFFGAPAVLFANRFFSPNRFSRMLKGNSKRHIENAARDLSLVQDWRKLALKNKDTFKPVLLITRDKAVRDMALNIAADSEKQQRRLFVEVWGKSTGDGRKVYENYRELWESVGSDEQRGRRLTHDYQLQIMASLEEELFRGSVDSNCE